MQAIKEWFASYTNPDSDLYNKKDVVIPAAVHELYTNLGMTEDQIGRMRTGAAITEEERRFFSTMMGAMTDGADILRSKISSFYRYIQAQHKSIFEAALLDKYNNDHKLVEKLIESYPDKAMYAPKMTEQELFFEEVMEGVQNEDVPSMKKSLDPSLWPGGVTPKKWSDYEKWYRDGKLSQKDYDELQEFMMTLPDAMEGIDEDAMPEEEESFGQPSTTGGFSLLRPHSGPSRRPVGKAAIGKEMFEEAFSGKTGGTMGKFRKPAPPPLGASPSGLFPSIGSNEFAPTNPVAKNILKGQ